MRAAWDSIFIQCIIFTFRFCTGIERDECFRKMDAAAGRIYAEGVTGKQAFIEHDRVKGSIPEESFRADQRVCPEIVLECGDEKPCVMDGFIFIRGAGLFPNNDLRMVFEKIIIVKGKVADDPKAICDNTDFVGIAEVAVNVELPDLRVGSRVGWHGGISGLIRVILAVEVMVFGIGFELLDDTVGIFGIILSDPGLDSGGIKNSHVCFGGIDGLADGFGKVNETVKKVPDVLEEILLKAGDLRSVGDFIKATELAEGSGIVKEYQEQGIRRDRKDFLDDEGP